MIEIYILNYELAKELLRSFNQQLSIELDLIKSEKIKHDKVLSIVLDELLLRKYHLHSDEIIKSDNGKPYVLNNPIYYNKSHSYDLGVIAFSLEEIGIDLEKKRTISHKLRNLFAIDLLENKEKYNINDKIIEKFTTLESYLKLNGLPIFNNYKNVTINEEKCIVSLNGDKPANFKRFIIEKKYILTVSSVKEQEIIFSKIEKEFI